MLLRNDFQITQCSAQSKVLGSEHHLYLKKYLHQNPNLSLTTVLSVIYNPSYTALKSGNSCQCKLFSSAILSQNHKKVISVIGKSHIF